MVKAFRAISILEGLSYLMILSVTLGVIAREWVYFLGMGHGILFVLYLILSLIVSGKKGWPILKWLALFLASIMPFAFILVEIYLQKIEKNNPQ